jgi:hypothetical protein
MAERNLFYEQLERESDGDYVEVVRCKDCENWERDWDPQLAKNKRYCAMTDLFTTGEWYCAWGERRE